MSDVAQSVTRPRPGPSPHPPSGVRLAGVAAGIKSDPALHDVAVVALDRPGTAVGVFTQNRVTAAPVQLSRQRVPTESIRAVVINSGNANACTGDLGLEDARRMAGVAAERLGCDQHAVLVCSTGIIGEALPMQRLERGIALAVEQLDASNEALESAARAMMTTDTVPKWSHRVVASSNEEFAVVGVAKGAAMMAPRMATMLAVVMTDATISPTRADALLRRAVDASFNCISIDGHTSTNDTVLLLASGAAPVSSEAIDETALGAAIDEVCIDLAKAIVADGEGATHRVTIDVEGARSRQQASQLARAIGDSPLVKTAVFGADPNWGRILSAAGYAGVEFDPDDCLLWLQETLIYEKGSPVRFDAQALSHAMRSNFDVGIRLKLHQGGASVRFWAADLSEEYVRLNAHYHT